MSNAIIFDTNGEYNFITLKDVFQSEEYLKGYAEIVPLGKDYYAVVNENGLLIGLDENPFCASLVGDIIVVKYEKPIELKSISQTEVKEILLLIKDYDLNRMFSNIYYSICKDIDEEGDMRDEDDD